MSHDVHQTHLDIDERDLPTVIGPISKPLTSAPAPSLVQVAAARGQAREQWSGMGAATARAQLESHAKNIVVREKATQLRRRRDLQDKRREHELQLRAVAAPVAAPMEPTWRLEAGVGVLGGLVGAVAGVLLSPPLAVIALLTALGVAMPVVTAGIGRLLAKDAREPDWMRPGVAAAVAAGVSLMASSAAATQSFAQGGQHAWLHLVAAALTMTVGVSGATWFAARTMAARAKALKAEAEKDALRDVLRGKLEVLGDQLERAAEEAGVCVDLAEITAAELLRSGAAVGGVSASRSA